MFESQRAAFAREPYPSLSTRRDRLARLLRIVTAHEKALCDAIDRDFGHRPHQETRLAELYIVAAEIRNAIRQLPRWMRARRVATPIKLLPGSACVFAQPRGVTGISRRAQ